MTKSSPRSQESSSNSRNEGVEFSLTKKFLISVILFVFSVGCSKNDTAESFVNSAPPSGSLQPVPNSTPTPTPTPEATPTPTPSPTPTPESPISSSLSSISYLGASVIADGVATGTLTISLIREDATPASGVIPSFSATDTGGTNTYGVCSVSDSSGISQCTLASTKAESKTLALLTPVNLTGGTITFVAGAASAANSSIVATGPVKADGSQTSTVTITLKDAHQNPLIGTVPTFSATNTSSRNNASACSATNVSGISTCTLTSTYAESKSFNLTSPIALAGNTVNFTSGGLDLVVPIEMIDNGLSSNTTQLTFERSTTFMNPDDYDGTRTFSFELLGYNGDSVSRSAEVIDQDGNPVSTFTYLAGEQGKVIRNSFTPASGTNKSYRIRLEATTAANQLIIYNARILIRQQGATKTRLFFPLLARNYTTYSSSLVGETSATNNPEASYNVGANVSIHGVFKRNDSAFSQLASTGTFEFDVIHGSHNSSQTSYVALFNRTTNTQVPGTEFSTTINLTRNSTPISSSLAEFADGNDFEIRGKAASTAVKFYKAGIWMRLENLTKAEVFFRTSRSITGASATMSAHSSKWKYEGSYFSNPQVFFQSMGASTVSSATVVRIRDLGTTDVGTAAGTSIASSELTLTTTDRTIQRSSNIVGDLTHNNYYFIQCTNSSATATVYNTNLIYSISQ